MAQHSVLSNAVRIKDKPYTAFEAGGVPYTSLLG